MIPLKLREVTVEQGLLTGSFENPKGIGTKVKYGNLLLFEELKKKLMALNCVNISKSYTAWEEKNKMEASLSHSTFSSRGGHWKFNQQKTTNFLLYL